MLAFGVAVALAGYFGFVKEHSILTSKSRRGAVETLRHVQRSTIFVLVRHHPNSPLP